MLRSSAGVFRPASQLAATATASDSSAGRNAAWNGLQEQLPTSRKPSIAELQSLWRQPETGCLTRACSHTRVVAGSSDFFTAQDASRLDCGSSAYGHSFQQPYSGTAQGAQTPCSGVWWGSVCGWGDRIQRRSSLHQLAAPNSAKDLRRRKGLGGADHPPGGRWLEVLRRSDTLVTWLCSLPCSPAFAADYL